MIVHSINKHSVVGFTNGRTQHLIVDSVVYSNPSMLDYSLKGSRIKSGISAISYSCFTCRSGNKSKICGLIGYKNGFFQFQGKKGVVISPLFRLPDTNKQLVVDYVILTSNTKQKLEKLKENFPGAQFIADASNSLRKCKSWALEAEKFGLKFYSVRDNGAWVMNAGQAF